MDSLTQTPHDLVDVVVELNLASFDGVYETFEFVRRLITLGPAQVVVDLLAFAYLFVDVQHALFAQRVDTKQSACV